VSHGFDVVEFTAGYEDWLGARMPLVAADLLAKHAQMQASVLRFLRGTYYVWLRRVADLQPQLLDRPAVPAVGDLHIENFGTWRDRDGRRRWGVNDLDELAYGSYALDLVRLATSAALAPAVALPTRHLCHVLLEHWQSATPGPAVDIDTPAATHLRALVPEPDQAHAYYAALRKAATADAEQMPDRVRMAATATVADGWQPTWHTRQAGTGSLGHPRLVAVGRDGAGRWQAREVKLLGPATVDWLRDTDPTVSWPVAEPDLYSRVSAAMHGPDPAARVEGWQLRRLAPDVVRIELMGLVARDAERVVRSMAQAIVDVHGSQPDALAAARADGAGRKSEWLKDAVQVMLADTRACHERWVRR
jgi:uncharacterized protein (DUF2252 family)